MKYDNLKPKVFRKSSSKREVYSNTIPPQELNRQPDFTHKATGKRTTKKLKLVEGKKS